MRLYLSSFDLGNETSYLVDLAPQGQIALIMNALDNQQEARDDWRARQHQQLKELEFAIEELDLRNFFGAPDLLDEVMAGFDMLWINGGNTFILRRAMQLSGFDAIVKKKLSRDEIVYAGFSAATVVTAPSLRGLEAIDNPNDVPDGYTKDVVWEGLGLLPFSIVVHHQSDHAESSAVEQEIAFYERENVPYRTLRDGQAFVVRGSLDTITTVG